MDSANFFKENQPPVLEEDRQLPEHQEKNRDKPAIADQMENFGYALREMETQVLDLKPEQAGEISQEEIDKISKRFPPNLRKPTERIAIDSLARYVDKEKEITRWWKEQKRFYTINS